jgi:hypothetical protein
MNWVMSNIGQGGSERGFKEDEALDVDAADDADVDGDGDVDVEEVIGAMIIRQ